MYVLTVLGVVGILGSLGCSRLGQALRFIEEPTSVIARRNSQVFLNCNATAGPTGSSTTKIVWRKDGVLLRSNSNYVVRSSGHLTIRQFRGKKGGNSDEGVYQCFASNKEGTIASRKAWIRLAVLSRQFKEWPKSATVLQGETVRFACQAKHAIPEPTVVWKKDGQMVIPGVRHVILPNGVLQILKVQKSDEGSYQCIIENIARRRTSLSGLLTVKQAVAPVKNPIHFAIIPGNTSAVTGHKVIMECIATGIPVPFVQWKKVGRYNKQNLNATSANEGSSNLQISSVSVRDQGEYLCVISSEGKTIMQSVYLFVKEPPQFTKTPPENGIAFQGKTVQLKCSAKGSPLPKITWLKNGKVINLLDSRITMSSTGQNNRDLLIAGISKKDEGVYQCFAENALGSTQSSTRVIVKRSAMNMSPPHSLVGKALSASEISVTWKPPNGHPKLAAYGVTVQPMDNSSKKNTQVSQNTSYTITNLQGNTYYSIYVTPFFRKYGMGIKSATIKIKTLEGKPTSPPVNIDFTSNTPDSIDVYWFPPPKRYQNGFIMNYFIRYSPQDGSSQPRIIQVSSAVKQKTVSGLTSGKSYGFELAAETSKGIGPFSNRMFFPVSTKYLTMISAPNINISFVNSTALGLTWQKPLFGHNKVKQYKLSYIKDSAPFEGFGPFNVSRNLNQYVISGLSPDTNYIVKLIAWDGKNLGQPSVESQKTAIGKMKSGYGKQLSLNPKCQPTSPNTLWISWQTVFSPKRIASYKLWYEISGNINHETILTKTVRTGLSTYLHSLIPGKKYRVTIKPLGSDGKEIMKFFQSVVECETPEAAPSTPPRNIQFKVESMSSLQLNWEPPQTPNGHTTKYVIAYSTDRNLPDEQWKQVVNTLSLRFFQKFEKFVRATLTGLKYNSAYFIKIKAGNKQGYGPYSKPIKVLMVLKKDSQSTIKLSFRIISQSAAEVKWSCPTSTKGKPVQYRVIYTNKPTLPHSEWFHVPVVVNSGPQKADRSVSVQIANLSVNQTYYVKVQADYGKVVGPWSEQLEIKIKDNPDKKEAVIETKNSTTNPGSDTQPSKNKSEKEDFEVKLGIIIGCIISAFCVVILVLFIIWRCPCRFSKNQHLEQKKSGVPNGSPSNLSNGLPNGYSTSHQSVASNRLGGRNYEESSGGSSIGSSVCQCRCTCSAGRWPLPNLQTRPQQHTGNGHIITGNGHLVTPNQTPPKSKPYSIPNGQEKAVMNGYSLQEPPIPLQMLAVHENGKVVVGTKPTTTKSISVDV